ncbi:hypothetical protein CAEBREN_20709 [Caenorhabditis brenneri]|uniref:Uncharacterized protein n=1 Tax=Caenorhabditis brenneri TaxID=135651 RepID=G0PBT6_CAEBE|nr:hypothetical protein CAEBREN_20709 [Caenorhabditis brenneri]
MQTPSTSTRDIRQSVSAPSLLKKMK